MSEAYQVIPADERAALRHLLPDGVLTSTKELCLNDSGESKRCCRPKGHSGTLHIWATNWASDKREAGVRWFSS